MVLRAVSVVQQVPKALLPGPPGPPTTGDAGLAQEAGSGTHTVAVSPIPVIDSSIKREKTAHG